MNQRQLFQQHLAQTSPEPLGIEIERAEGLYLYGKNGKRWLDLISGIGPSAFGHRHPRIQGAVQAQLDKYWHTMVYGEFVLSPQVELAKMLAEQLKTQAPLPSPQRGETTRHTSLPLGELEGAFSPPSGGLGRASVFLTNSGTEAAEGAMKLAKRHTGRTQIISCKNAYHGSTQGAMSLQWPHDFTDAYRPLLPDIQHITFNNFESLSVITERTACVFAETVQAESGIHPPNPKWLLALRNRCTEVGALLVLDEIQAAYGRTGHLFAFQKYGIEPDILLLAKAFGGGMPIGAFVAPKHIMDDLSDNPILGHITTFGGHPVAAAAAVESLKILLETDLMAQVPRKEALFLELLKHPKIKAVRSAGLWLAIELESFEEIQRVIKRCIENGLLTDWFLWNSKSLRICPPLTIGEAEIRWSCGVILGAL